MTTGVLMSTVQAVKAALGPLRLIERWQTHLHHGIYFFIWLNRLEQSISK